MSAIEKAKSKAISALSDFILSPKRNDWVYTPHLEMYVRKGYHYINGSPQHTFDFANIQVMKHKGKGLGMSVIEEFHLSSPFSITFIESILNDDFYTKLKANGWIDVEGSKPPSVFKSKS